MKNYKITLGYDGTRYQGWQKQGNTEQTIQGKLEGVLSKFEGSPVEVQGSGRTDSGVHALGQVANVKLERKTTVGELRRYLNDYLPSDIVVYSIEEVSPRFHARLNACEKTYEYEIWQDSVPPLFQRGQVWIVNDSLDLEKMREAADLLLGTHDFLGFSALKKAKKSTTRTITSIAILRDGSLLRLKFTGDGFLMHEIRILVGTLVEIAAGKRDISCIPQVFSSKNREQAGVTAPACGLFLLNVSYPESL